MGEAKAQSSHSQQRARRASFITGERKDPGLSPAWLFLEGQVEAKAHSDPSLSPGDQIGL